LPRRQQPHSIRLQRPESGSQDFNLGEAKRRKTRQGSDTVDVQSRIGSALDAARAAHRNRDLRSAVNGYSQVLALDPAHAEATHLSGLALVELGELEIGLAQLQRAAMLLPGDASVHYNLGRALLLRGDPAGAVEQFDHALSLQPDYGRAQFQRACTLETLQQTELAAAAFLEAARLQPDRVLAHVGASRQLYKLDRVTEAMASQARAAALDDGILADGRIGQALADTSHAGRAALRRHSADACERGDACQSDEQLLAAIDALELVVLDDVLPDALEYRERALALPYRAAAAAQVNFPGSQTAGGFASQDLCQRVADALGRDLKWGWPDHGAFRVSPASATARSDVHADHDDDRPAYAGVLYLSLPQHCRGGTSFWRHRATGWTRVPDPASGRASRWGSTTAFMRSLRDGQERPFATLAAARSDWELLLTVPMRFNRLIVYRSDHFHSIAELFGETPADSRLVQLLFFERLAGRA
jgi:tetratricopeptide (TPR) repeat protein